MKFKRARLSSRKPTLVPPSSQGNVRRPGHLNPAANDSLGRLTALSGALSFIRVHRIKHGQLSREIGPQADASEIAKDLLMLHGPICNERRHKKHKA